MVDHSFRKFYMTAICIHTTFTAKLEPHIQIAPHLITCHWRFYHQKQPYTQRWCESVYFLKLLLFSCHCFKELKCLFLDLTCNIRKKEKILSYYSVM